MINTYIPYLKNTEKKNLIDCIKTNFVSTAGPKLAEFENLFSKIFRFKNSVAVNSGTSALHLALLSLNVKKNDLIIVPSYTFAATANAICYVGAEPWFFDCDENFILDLSKVEQVLINKTKLTKKKLIVKSSGKTVKAIVVVQSLGKKIEFKKYQSFANKYNLKIIFDSAACHDPKILNFKKDNKSIFCFSFNGNKTLTTGAGGVLSTNSKTLSKKVRLLAGVGKKKSNYDYVEIGYNYKMTNIQASMGISQLNGLNNILLKKKKIFEIYKKLLDSNLNFKLIYDNENINWVFAIVLKKKQNFIKLKKKFNKCNIQLDYFWKPLHLQKPYKNFKKENLNNTNQIWKKIIILPSHPSIKKIDQKLICSILNSL